ncbi:hypothetical protein GCM10010329_15090 [Streptomyces spiroverticillatus]|uniref:Uncharacterized protein n=1 Tax=Streptomyces finlayi TaxID=67296 RepID=A0A918X3J9_9ACTN|nr:hypothetical protein GCM10010329_15090 [Streptomyces spiroverticillatus]GHD07018.1 hypothetical protein GCM10010334_59120 [Streptomyces finlayi]
MNPFVKGPRAGVTVAAFGGRAPAPPLHLNPRGNGDRSRAGEWVVARAVPRAPDGAPLNSLKET